MRDKALRTHLSMSQEKRSGGDKRGVRIIIEGKER